MQKSPKIEKIIGIYNYHSGILGKLSYLYGTYRGTTNYCYLRGITHKSILMKKEWKKFNKSL